MAETETQLLQEIGCLVTVKLLELISERQWDRSTVEGIPLGNKGDVILVLSWIDLAACQLGKQRRG